MIEVNWVAVLAAAVANFVVGFIWFGPLFGKAWKNWMGFSDESMRTMPLTAKQAMVGGFITSLVMAYVLGMILSATTSISGALMFTFWLWLGFVATTTAGMWLWEGKSFKLFALVAGGHLAAMLVMAVVLVWMM